MAGEDFGKPRFPRPSTPTHLARDQDVGGSEGDGPGAVKRDVAVDDHGGEERRVDVNHQVPALERRGRVGGLRGREGGGQRGLGPAPLVQAFGGPRLGDHRGQSDDHAHNNTTAGTRSIQVRSQARAARTAGSR